MKAIIFSLLAVSLALCSCGEEKRQAVFYSTEDAAEDSTVIADSYTEDSVANEPEQSDWITVPFEERDGVKYIKVSVNGFGFKMIFDTGCSSTLISVAEANYLYQKGYLTQEDILDTGYSQIADGSIVENMIINLKEVIIDDQIRCTNVTACVSQNVNAPLLLGNEILDRAESYSVDNDNKVIKFKLKK
ncbi:MAG: retroviral-like aspartic protease family protein [Muribaculaceae bacterium]